MRYVVILILWFVLIPGIPQTVSFTTFALGFLGGVALSFILADIEQFFYDEWRNEP